MRYAGKGSWFVWFGSNHPQLFFHSNYTIEHLPLHREKKDQEREGGTIVNVLAEGERGRWSQSRRQKKNMGIFKYITLLSKENR